MARNRFALGLSLLLLAGCQSGGSQEIVEADTDPAFTTPETIGELDFGILPEASGMTISRIRDNHFWFVNDAGNAAQLIGIDGNNMQHQKYRVNNARNHDWEDLAAFELNGESWILIADVGDNNAIRDHVRFYFVREPAMGANPRDALQALGPINFVYEDGPRDVESVAVDVARDAIYLLSKRTKPPVLYSLPLRSTMHATQRLSAKRLGPVNTLPAPSQLELRLFPKYGKYRAQPTAMELSADGSAIALLTYGEAYCFAITPEQSWLDALNTEPMTIGMPYLAQPETIALDADGYAYISTEREAAPLLKFKPTDKE